MALGAAQDAFYTALRARTDIEWSRITVLHVDTYMGVAESRTESGASRMRKLRWTLRASRQAVIPETMGMTAPSGQGGRLATASAAPGKIADRSTEPRIFSRAD